MNSTRRHERTPSARSELPEPRCGARWRWSTHRTTLVAGGALAAVLSLGAGTAAAGAATATASSSTPAGPRGQPPAGAARLTVLGKVTALTGSEVTVQTRGKKTTTVVSSSATTFKTMSGPNGTPSSSSASALKVGAFVGVLGTKNSDGSVTASSIVISTAPPPGGAGGAPGHRGAPPSGAPNA